MALSVNLAQINSAAKGNNDLRETLTSIHLALQGIYANTGTAPLAKVDTNAANFTAPPAASQLAVSGANGSFRSHHQCWQGLRFIRRSRVLR